MRFIYELEPSERRCSPYGLVRSLQSLKVPGNKSRVQLRGPKLLVSNHTAQERYCLRNAGDDRLSQRSFHARHGLIAVLTPGDDFANSES